MIDRRGLLVLGSASALSLAVSTRGLAAAVDPFTLGVASGDPTPDGVVLWTRLAPDPLAEDGSGGLRAPVPVTWEVAADEGMKHVVRRGRTIADAAFGHSVHVEVAGLSPGRPYWYRFEAQGHRSRVGRTKTAPALGAPAAMLTCAIASCSHYEVGYFSAYRHMAEEQPDLIFFLGDYMYEYSYTGQRADHAVRHHDRPDEVKTLAAYRNRYALHHMDPDLAQLHAASPALMTWDDHEVSNDYANQWSQDPKVPVDAFLKRRADAYRAYYENMPLRPLSLPRGPDMRVYDRLKFGDLAEVTVLDGRQYRTEQPCPLPTRRSGHLANCPEISDPSRTMLGGAQERWLYEGFRSARAKWNIVAQDLLIAPLPGKMPDGSTGHYTDGWDGYAQTRSRMLHALSEAKTPNAVFFGGDIHSFWTTDLKANYDDPASPTVATEFVGTSITSDNPPASFVDKAALAERAPWVKFMNAETHGYMSVEVTPERLSTKFQIVSDRRDPKATVSTLKSWVVESGKAGGMEG
ncbi:MAG TPA: alkaline phosphatase D family protein [Caulobacteraceae bacterium]|nr:alkaline phosphatase D family protein [Caulobacteraceae bacterium]